MSQVTVRGSCLCGSVKYEITGETKRFYHCHCVRCRKATGAGFSSNFLVSPKTSITWLRGEPFLAKYRVPESARFYNRFCLKCGSTMPYVLSVLDAVVVPAGSLDTGAPIEPQGHMFWDSRASWSCTYDLPAFSEYPEDKGINGSSFVYKCNENM